MCVTRLLDGVLSAERCGCTYRYILVFFPTLNQVGRISKARLLLPRKR